MKMFRLLTGMIALIMITLVGCSNQSPDFSPQLHSISLVATAVAPNTSTGPNLAVGDQIQYKVVGLCTTPPGTKATTAEINAGTATVEQGVVYKPCAVKPSDVTWSVDNSGANGIAGTITDTGLFTAGPGTGTVVVKAQVDDKHASTNLNAEATVVVGPPALRSLVVTPATATISKGGSQNYTVQGRYSDGVTRPLAATDTVEWTSSDVGVATVNPTTGTTTTATAVNPGTTTITACSPTCASATKVTGTATLTVNNQVLIAIQADLKLTPPSATVSVGFSQNYQMMGIYSSDGGATTTTQPIPNSMIDWTVDNTAIATIAAAPADNKVVATGVAVGLATITGTLKPAVAATIADPSKKAATGTLTVVVNYCTAPYSQPAASTTVDLAPLCLGGLLCSVGNKDNVIDADPTNFTTLNGTIGIGLLNSNVTLTVNSGTAAQVPPAAGQIAGFVIARPAGLLLSAEVLSQFSVSTLLGGVVQESFTTSASATLPPLLRVTLLGAIGGIDQALISINAAKPYDAMSISFGTGLVSVLQTTNVYAACGKVDPTKLPGATP